MADPLVSVRDLTVSYGDRPVLDGLDLDVRRGEVLGVVGESGGGKTTLALALAGVVPAPGRARGSVTFSPPDGDPVDALALDGREARQFRARRVAVVTGGGDALLPGETVGDHVATACRDAGVDREAGRERARRTLRQFGYDPTDVLDARPGTLSDGARRAGRVAAAAALDPAVLVLDQPPFQFDAIARRVDLHGFAEEVGLTLVLVGADLRGIAAQSDRLAVLYGGRIVETGPVADLLAGADHPFARRLFRPFGGD